VRPAGNPAQQILLGKGRPHRVVFEEPVALQDQKVARGIGRLINAVLLGRVATGGEFHARSVGAGPNHVACARFHPTDGVGHGATFLVGCVGLAGLRHQGFDLCDVGIGKAKRCLHAAAVGMADIDGVVAGGFRMKIDIMLADGAEPFVGTAEQRCRDAGGRQANDPLQPCQLRHCPSAPPCLLDR